MNGGAPLTCVCASLPPTRWMHPPPRCDGDVQCANGGLCTDGDWGANCTCRLGFTGDRYATSSGRDYGSLLATDRVNLLRTH